jgi:MFS family permease
MNAVAADASSSLLDRQGRYLVLAAAFLGWMFAGVQMGIMPLCTGPATRDFARRGIVTSDALDWGNLLRFAPRESRIGDSTVAAIAKIAIPKWYAWYSAAFLFGAASGGLVFGWIGDRAGRVKALSLSILCYSLVSAASYVSQTPEQLVVLRFLAAMGVGGMWPAGVALASEAWSDVSRPTLAGLIGTAANVGIMAVSATGIWIEITEYDWRWLLLAAGTSSLLGIFVWCCVPESPGWLAARHQHTAAGTKASLWQVFKPPLLKLTLLGICLGTIPLLGGWGTTSWVIPWADKVNGVTDPGAKAVAALMRSGGGTLGSLLGGWLANLFGRRTMYFLISLTSLLLAGYIFRVLTPDSATVTLVGCEVRTFSLWVFALGFVSTIFFGWLPLYLPELFPTHARATGTGVSFNFGRIATAFGVLGTGLLTGYYDGDYAKVGQVTSLIYALGMVIILFAPDTSRKRLQP